MIIRQLKSNQYESFYKDLIQKAHAEPMAASYTVDMNINSVEYAVRVQPEGHNRVAILQALRIERNGGSPNFELITKGNLLSSLLEILIYQGLM